VSGSDSRRDPDALTGNVTAGRPGDDAGVGGSGDDAGVVDARGTACPMPIILLAQRATAHLPGTELTVLATDIAARYDVPAWARMTGHTFVGEKETDGGAWALTVRLKG